MPPRSLIHRRGHSAVDFLTGDDSYPVASGFLGRYHHQIIVCIYFNGRVLNRRKVANHDENTEKTPTRRWANIPLAVLPLRRMVSLANRRHKGKESHPAILAAAPVAVIATYQHKSRLPEQDSLSKARRKESIVGFYLEAALSPPVTVLSRLSRLPRQP